MNAVRTAEASSCETLAAVGEPCRSVGYARAGAGKTRISAPAPRSRRARGSLEACFSRLFEKTLALRRPTSMDAASETRKIIRNSSLP